MSHPFILNSNGVLAHVSKSRPCQRSLRCTRPPRPRRGHEGSGLSSGKRSGGSRTRRQAVRMAVHRHSAVYYPLSMRGDRAVTVLRPCCDRAVSVPLTARCTTRSRPTTRDGSSGRWSRSGRPRRPSSPRPPTPRPPWRGERRPSTMATSTAESQHSHGTGTAHSRHSHHGDIDG